MRNAPSAEGRLGGGLVFEVAGHQGVAAERDFAERRRVARDILPVLADHPDAAGGRVAHALARERARLVGSARHVPVVAQGAAGRRPVRLGQPIEMHEVDAERLQLLDQRARRRRTAGRDLDAPRQRRRSAGMVEEHVEHHRRAAEMRHAVLLDGVEDEAGIGPVDADMRPAGRGDGPAVAPAVAVEHGQGPEIDRLSREAEFQHVAERVQIGAAVVIDDPFRTSGGAGGVVEADGLPFIRDGARVERLRRGRGQERVQAVVARRRRRHRRSRGRAPNERSAASRAVAEQPGSTRNSRLSE